MSRPAAITATIWFGACGGRTSVYFNYPPGIVWNATVTGPAAGWLSIEGPSQGRGSGLVTLTAGQSTSAQNDARLVVSPLAGAEPINWQVAQFSTVPLSTMNTSVLAVPFFPRTPTVMELGIAGKFIAQEVKKIPEPFTLIALAVVEIVVILLGILALVVRGLLAELVPEPKTWFGAPPPYDALTHTMPATAVFITEETTLLALYIAEQTLAGD